MEKIYKIVIFSPESHADVLREAISAAGAGVIGNYTHCTFSVKGISRFKPIQGANPAIGAVDKMEEVSEERIETVCVASKINNVLKAIREVHPYEETATDVYSIELLK